MDLRRDAEEASAEVLHEANEGSRHTAHSRDQVNQGHHEHDGSKHTKVVASPKKPNPAVTIVSSHANAQDECKGPQDEWKGRTGMQTAKMRAGERPEDA